VTSHRRTEHGYLQQDPLPSEEELGAYYAERYYQTEETQYRASYDAEERAWFDLDAALAQLVVDEVAPSAPRTLLDVGCGEGFFMAGLLTRGWEVAGCDFSAYGITRCNPEVLPWFEQGDLYRLLDEHLGRGARYGLVNLSNVLEHVRDPEGLLGRLGALVADGGLVRINVPHDFSALQALLLERGAVDRPYWVVPVQHLNYFDRSSLAATLAATGWDLARLLADFPIEHFLLHPGSNYVTEPSLGRDAHRARVTLDLHHSRDLEAYARMLEAQAACGVGRSLIAFARQRRGEA
jgi:SAM-dependent methyltransferase